MSEAALSALQKRVEELTTENATLKSEAKDRRIKGKKLQEQLDALTTERDALSKERDDLKVKAEAGPKELTDTIADLRGKLTTRDHRDAFAGVKEFTVKGEDGKESAFTLNDGVTVDALWKYLDYQAEGDAPDAAKITGLMGEAVKSASYLFKPKAETATTGAGAPQHPSQAQRREPGPSNGTHGSNSTSARPSVFATVTADYASSGRKIPGKL